MKVLASVMTHGSRAKHVGRTVASIQRSTVPVDVLVWCNGTEAVECGVPVLRGTNAGSESQKLSAALLLTDYDVYCHFDDDVLAESTLIERALRLLDAAPETLVCSGGSVIAEGEDVANRKWHSMANHASAIPQMYVDLFDAWAFIMQRKLVGNLLHFEPSRATGWIGTTDIWWGPGHWACGGTVTVIEQPPTVLQWCPEHWSGGMCSHPQFAARRTEAIRQCLRCWTPRAEKLNR